MKPLLLKLMAAAIGLAVLAGPIAAKTVKEPDPAKVAKTVKEPVKEVVKDWKQIRFAADGSYPPFNQLDADHNLQGFDIEIGKALCAKLSAECSFIVQDWDGLIPQLLANRYDAILSSMAITEDRLRKVDFTDRYYDTSARFVTRKVDGVGDVTPAGLKGKILGVQAQTTHATYLDENYRKSGVAIQSFPTIEATGAALKAHQIDAMIGDSIVLYEWLEKTDTAAKCCQFIGAEIHDARIFGAGAGIAVRKEDQPLKQLLDKALAEMIKDGTYEKINRKFFPVAIY